MLDGSKGSGGQGNVKMRWLAAALDWLQLAAVR